MAELAVLGASGFAGSRILAEALRRGHHVVAVAPDLGGIDPDQPGLTLCTGDVFDVALITEVTANADVLVVAIPPEMPGDKRLADAIPPLLGVARTHGARLGIVGGAGSLLVAEGGPRLLDTPEFPGVSRSGSEMHAKTLETLRAHDSEVDWFYVSPAVMFGPHAPGVRLGHYRIGGDVQLTNSDGLSAIGGEDFAIAFVDEIENPRHHRTRFTVAY